VSSSPVLPATLGIQPLATHTFRINVVPGNTRAITPVVTLTHAGRQLSMTGRTMQVLSPPPITRADYVPEPAPAPTDYLIATYYYPGYGHPYQYRQMERSAPWAKPALGYYDEGNPECIDWQIKWAVEHGVGCFLVDWYWVAGSKRHMHWLEGFEKARYRRYLKWAVMWANHNPAGTHSEEDWRNVTQFWIRNYFAMPEYLRIGGKPVVAIWSPRNIRNDMGGSEEAGQLLELSQQMARKAGLQGIHFVAMNNGGASTQLRAEGYAARTWYHWWGKARETSPDPDYTDYADVVRHARNAWDERNADVTAAGLDFLPVVDTGWDARPRHGNHTFVIYNRTPELFRQALNDAKKWLDKNKQRLLVLAPWNEWTEGSYIEPCAEFDFRMLEAIHSVFCGGPLRPALGPRDVGLGPYDFELSQPGSTRTDWVFNADDALGWTALMGLTDWRVSDEGLAAATSTRDPALRSEWLDLNANEIAAVEITLSITPAPKAGSKLVFFWGTESAPINSRAHVSVPLEPDTDRHVYQLNLASHSRWRGRIRYLRLDPCQEPGCSVRISRIRLLP